MKISQTPKVGIITLFDMNNYGNRLQNYAVQTVLKDCGCQPYTIVFQPKWYPLERRLKHLFTMLLRYRVRCDVNYWKKEIYRYYAFERNCRGKFQLFNLKAVSDLESIRHKFDYFIVGSDQVWNTTLYDSKPEISRFYLAAFACPEKRIAFSPSFGMDEIPERWASIFSEELKDYRMLTCREQIGVDIIEQLTGRKAQLLPDPTLMLSRSEWDKWIRRPRKVDVTEPYVLTYFLGEYPKRAKKLLEKLNIQHIINLADYEVPVSYYTGPSDFLYLICHAKLILTDSYHGCIFSFIYNRPFVVFSREGKETKMFSRIDTLLKTYHLERKYIDNLVEDDVFECDYSVGKRILSSEIRKGYCCIKEAFGKDAG